MATKGADELVAGDIFHRHGCVVTVRQWKRGEEAAVRRRMPGVGLGAPTLVPVDDPCGIAVAVVYERGAWVKMAERTQSGAVIQRRAD
jgi:hypothetical protein